MDMVLHHAILAVRKLRQEGGRKSGANLSHISSKPGPHRDPPVPTQACCRAVHKDRAGWGLLGTSGLHLQQA